MICVINPSGTSGHSFKGLHAYCAHDPDRAQTAERVDWIETRNIAANDPGHAWKVMAATAGAQNELKRAAGVRAGRASKDGAVMHVVLSFDKDEPTDREAMQAAADDFLANLGVDPAKARGKNKPKRRQFADEHQVVMYAHRDTENAHLHLMINTVHPEHGVKLPTSNNFLKSQKWALEYSKRHGTDHKTPARQENAEMRERGEYVKGQRRKTRNAFERDQVMRAANENDQAKAILAAETKKDAELSKRGRNLKATQDSAWDRLIEGHRARKASIDRDTQRRINAARAVIREEFRPQWRKLAADQDSERKTFAELERSFFGRAANVATAMRLSSSHIGTGRGMTIGRMFKILTNASDRKAAFEQAQERARSALQREQNSAVYEAAKIAKASQRAKLTDNRAVLSAQRAELIERQKIEKFEIKEAAKKRGIERKAAFEQIKAMAKKPPSDIGQTPQTAKDRYRAFLLRQIDAGGEFTKAQSEAQEQNNTPSRDRGDDGQER